MRVFDHPNLSNGWKCPICKTGEDKEVVLIAIEGTQQGNIAEAEQFHLDCLELTYHKAGKDNPGSARDVNIIGMAFQ